MDQLLTVSSTRRVQPEDQIISVSTTQPFLDEATSLDSPEDILRALEAKPSFDLLTKCLIWLDKSRKSSEKFHIALPSPKVTQIVHALVNEIVPSYWPILKGSSDSTEVGQKRLLLRCLRSIVGIGALALRLRTLISSRSAANTSHIGDPQQNQVEGTISETLDVLEHMLRGHKTISHLWIDTQKAEKPIQRTILWKELISWLSRGKLLSIAGEAASVKGPENHDVDVENWVGNGRLFCTWLGQNIRFMFKSIDDDDNQEKEKAQLLGRAISLGYTGQ